MVQIRHVPDPLHRELKARAAPASNRRDRRSSPSPAWSAGFIGPLGISAYPAMGLLTGWLSWIGNTLACALYVVVFALTIQHYVLPDVEIFPVVGRQVQDVDVPEQCVVAAGLREDEFVGPREEVKAAQDVFARVPSGRKG